MKAYVEKGLLREEISNFVDSFPHATFFHTPAWVEILASSFPAFEPRWLTVRDGGELVGLMAFIEVSRGPFREMHALPFGTYGDPLGRDAGVRRVLLNEFFRMGRSARCLEAGASMFLGWEGGESPGSSRRRTEECRLINIEGGFEDFWRNSLSRKRRQLCNKAERRGVVTKLLRSGEELAKLYEIYFEESRSWRGIHPYPIKFFRELFGRSEEGVFFWGAFLEGELLGAHIDLFHGEMAQAWQAAVSKDASNYAASSLLIKKAVEEACRRGMRIFNLGSSGGNKGIMFFKESLGGEEYIYPLFAERKKWWVWLKGR